MKPGVVPDMKRASFEWDDAKNRVNLEKHGVAFKDAQEAFFDPDRIIFRDLEHEKSEKRFFCLGLVKDRVMTVRFTMRRKQIRIFGAGYWRQGRKRYEEENGIRR